MGVESPYGTQWSFLEHQQRILFGSDPAHKSCLVGDCITSISWMTVPSKPALFRAELRLYENRTQRTNPFLCFCWPRKGLYEKEKL